MVLTSQEGNSHTSYFYETPTTCIKNSVAYNQRGVYSYNTPEIENVLVRKKTK